MEGSLTRPRSLQYSDFPYLKGLDPDASIVDGRIAVSDEAWQQFETLLQVSGNTCDGIRTYERSNEDWQEQKAFELQTIGILFVVPLVGLLSPDMAHNCTLWREELRLYKDQAAGMIGVSEANNEQWQAFSAVWGKASDGIDQHCANYGIG